MVSSNLSQFSDDQIAELAYKIHQERKDRIVQNIKKGVYPNPNVQESDIYFGSKRAPAILAYSKRTNLDLMVSEQVLKHHFEKNNQ
jgi:hypothetical protein